jgi:transposase-like protein
MRYPASEKLEIIQLVERSHLPAKQTLDKLGVPRTTFYRWYGQYRAGGRDALQDKAPLPGRIWNRIPDDIRERLIALALEKPELSPRELAVTFTNTQGYFVSESSVYRLLKAHDLITSPAFIVMKAADEFQDKTTAINQQWQTDFTYLKIIGWGWMYLSTILDEAGMLPRRCNWPCKRPVVTRPTSSRSRDYSPTTARATSPATWLTGLRITA